MVFTLYSIGGVEAAAVLLRVVAKDLLLAQDSAPGRGGVSQVLGDVPRQPHGRLRRGRGLRLPVVRRRPAVHVTMLNGQLEITHFLYVQYCNL